MKRVLHPLFGQLASVTRQGVARQVVNLRGKNSILQSKPPNRIAVTEKQRNRLVRTGWRQGIQLKELISIVSNGLFLLWVRQAVTVKGAT